MNRRLVSGVTKAVALLVLVGCSSGGTDRAGGSLPTAPTVLTFANANDEPGAALAVFAANVERLSNGSLRITFKNNWRTGTADYETGTIDDAKEGKVDLAWAGSRAFDDVGITAFDPLHAPLLIDSLPLEQAVLENPLVSRMLGSLSGSGLTGLGVMPGPLRKPLGTAALLTPDDYRGKTLAVTRSKVAEATMRALGASFREIGSGGPITGADGVESQVSSIAGNGYDSTAPYLSANVNLWPRPVVVVMNSASFTRLGTAEQQALTSAARSGLAEVTARESADNDASVERICRRHATFLLATDAQLTALRSAVQPVYDQLAQVPADKDALAQIAALKARRADPADVVSCAGIALQTAPAAAGPKTPIDGRYRQVTTPEDLRRAGAAEDEITAANYGTSDIVLDRGRFTMAQVPAGNSSEGTFTVTGDVVVLVFSNGAGGPGANQEGEVFTFRWSLFHDLLTLRSVPGKVSPAPLLAQPLRRLGPATP